MLLDGYIIFFLVCIGFVSLGFDLRHIPGVVYQLN
jgi:hypothetical protein